MVRTYTQGFNILSEKNITTKDISKLCRRLTEEFNKMFNSNEFKFEPEPITEGGIIMVNFPNKDDEMYKTIRIQLGFMNNRDKWPWIQNEMIEKWESEPESKIITKDEIISTFLKAFHGAPVWTIEELEIFENCFSEIGLKRKGKYPSKKSLKCK